VKLLLAMIPLVVLASCMAACGTSELTGSTDPSSQRPLPGGQIVGFAHAAGGHAWLGLPFARPPVGELRWKAPRPPEPWTGTREALAFGPSCVQLAGPSGGRDGADAGEPTGSEDCLHLNVFAPRFEPDAVPGPGERLPVMLWVHGGGNTIGDAALYDGGTLAANGNVVVVTVQYRLGVLGWFSHPALRGDGTSADDRSGNYGTLDLVRALEWVEENVAAFGGDPRNVTVFGESAGGSNVSSLILSPRAAGLFHRAIVQSGGTRTFTRAQAEHWSDAPDPGHERSSRELIASWLVDRGAVADRAAARTRSTQMTPGELAAFVRSLPAPALLSAFDDGGLAGMYQAPLLIRDGRVLPEAQPAEVLRAGFYNRVPTILGSNRHENRLFALFLSEDVSRVFGLPVRVRDLRRYQLEADYPSLMWKALSVDEPARLMRAAQGPSVFAYRFDWDDEGGLPWLDFRDLLGAAHGMEIPFVFGRLQFFGLGWPVFTDEHAGSNRALSGAMRSYWTRFAATGDPGRGRDGALPAWTPWDEAGPDRFLVLDSGPGGIRMDGDALDREEVIRRVAADDRFVSDDERCRIYAQFVRYGRGMTRETYDAAHGGLCRERHPLEED
jgi:para-nitrobenzyl esterase